MGLKDVLAATVQELVTTGALTDATLRMGSSPKGLATTPPAIWFVPIGGSGGGPDAAITRSQQQSLGEIKRPLHTRRVNVDAHIWAGGPAAGDDYTAAEGLMNAFLSALHHTVYGGYLFVGETWVPSGTDVMTLGRRVICRVTLFLPVYELQANAPVSGSQPPSSVVVTTSTQTDQMNNTTSETVG